MGAVCTEKRACDLQAPRRNCYFFGKLLDQYHFELETAYFIYMRRLLNRLVTGYGVVCGLDVEASGENAIVIKPGLAIDGAGNEIIVDEPTQPIGIPPDLAPPPARDHDDDDDEGQHEGDSHVHVLLCYHECKAEPAPVLAGDCCEQEPCQPGVIRERYKVIFRPGCAPPRPDSCFPDLVSGGEIDHRTLARIVTEKCPPCPDDPCIPLANIRVGPNSEEHRCHPEEIDIAVRPIVYNNDLLFQLLLCKMTETNYRRLK